MGAHVVESLCLFWDSQATNYGGNEHRDARSEQCL